MDNIKNENKVIFAEELFTSLEKEDSEILKDILNGVYELFEKYDEVVIDNLNDYFYSIKRTPTIFEMEDTFKPDEIIMGIKDYSSIKNNFKIYFTRKRDLDGKR